MMVNMMVMKCNKVAMFNFDVVASVAFTQCATDDR